MQRFCVLNIGNTHTQIAVASSDKTTVEWESCHTFDTSAIPFTELPSDVLTVYSSVVPDITAIMQKNFPDAVPCFAQNIPFVDFSAAPPTLGMDRIVNCAALVQKYSSGIIIDAGTAITLEVVKNKKFIGGAILPGTKILAQAMHDYTGALPQIDCITAPNLQSIIPEYLTANAMQVGIQSAAVAGTLQLMNNFLKLLPPDSPVYVCGGGRQSILNQNTTQKLIDGKDDFTLKGLAVIALYYLNEQ